MLCVANGKIFLQFWHEERAYHPLLNLGAQPVTSSPIAITSNEVHVSQGKKYYVVLRDFAMMNYQTLSLDLKRLQRMLKSLVSIVLKYIVLTVICWTSFYATG